MALPPSEPLPVHLGPWGPESLARRTCTLAEAQAYCRRLVRVHYENFTVASLLLPASARQHFANIYAYCRWADDLADEVPDRDASLRLLDWWQQQLEACYRGDARHPVFVALRTTIAKYSIPQAPLLDLLSAFRQDRQKQRYDTFDEVLDYCRRSANPVGRLVLYVIGAYDDERARLADHICTGLQLANFCQDVPADYARGRIYIARETLDRFDCPAEALAHGMPREAARRVLAHEVDRAAAFLQSGLPLIAQVPGRCRIDVALFAEGGLAILRKIRSRQFDVWQGRPMLSRREKAWLVGRAAFRLARGAYPGNNAGRGADRSPAQKASRQSSTTLLRSHGHCAPQREGNSPSPDARHVQGRGTTDARAARWIESKPVPRPELPVSVPRVPQHDVVPALATKAEVTASYEHCHRIARQTARNFYFTFRFLPPAKRRSMFALYAFMRRTDDLADNDDAPLPQRRDALRQWRQAWHAALAGRFADPMLPAVADTVARWHIAPQYLEDVIDGVEMDLEQNRYATFDELLVYCHRVASAVGLASLAIWGFDRRGRQAAIDCGIAFQLTNILRDLREDAAVDRVYLPLEDLNRFGYTVDDLKRGVDDPRFRRLLRYEIDRARRYYRRGWPVLDYVDDDARTICRTMIRTYETLLDRIDAQQHEVLRRRLRLSGAQKLRIAAGAWWQRDRHRRNNAGRLIS